MGGPSVGRGSPIVPPPDPSCRSAGPRRRYHHLVQTIVLLSIATLHAAASLIAVGAYWRDKRAAQRGEWRVRERTLHLIALAGGWPGAILAQRLFRHKTSDRPFRLVFHAIIALHGALWLLAIYLLYVR